MTKKEKYFVAGGAVGVGLLFYLLHKNKSVKLDNVSGKVQANFKKSNDKYFAMLNPAAKPVFQKFLNDVNKLGYAYVISSSYRPSAEQAQLKKENSKNASPGYSTHEYGIGIDISVVKDGKWINKASPLSAWKNTGIVNLAKKYNMRWGGEFPGYSDPVHFDLGNTYNVVALYAKALKKYGTADKIRGNQMNLAA